MKRKHAFLKTACRILAIPILLLVAVLAVVIGLPIVILEGTFCLAADLCGNAIAWTERTILRFYAWTRS